jgi:hypothetical protein
MTGTVPAMGTGRVVRALVVAVAVAAIGGCGVHAGDGAGSADRGRAGTSDDRTATDGSADQTDDPSVLGSSDPTDATDDTTDRGSGATRDDYIDAVMTAGGAIPGNVQESSVRCLAEALVDAVGADELDAAGVTPSDLAQGRFVKELGWGLDDISAYSAAVGDELQGCPITSEVMVSSFAERYPDAPISDESRTCIDDEFSGSIADLIVKSIIDPTYDAANAGSELAPSLLAMCPSLATEITVAELEQQGKSVTPDGIACLRSQYDGLSETKDEVGSEDVSAAIVACRDELGL